MEVTAESSRPATGTSAEGGVSSGLIFTAGDSRSTGKRAQPGSGAIRMTLVVTSLFMGSKQNLGISVEAPRRAKVSANLRRPLGWTPLGIEKVTVGNTSVIHAGKDMQQGHTFHPRKDKRTATAAGEGPGGWRDVATRWVPGVRSLTSEKALLDRGLVPEGGTKPEKDVAQGVVPSLTKGVTAAVFSTGSSEKPSGVPAAVAGALQMRSGTTKNLQKLELQRRVHPVNLGASGALETQGAIYAEVSEMTGMVSTVRTMPVEKLLSHVVSVGSDAISHVEDGILNANADRKSLKETQSSDVNGGGDFSSEAMYRGQAPEEKL
ncbi:hypothetical protein NE237_012222 [Protea cynaroides]|uniref:Uncharacterized protein n=1 Tax=Protea cynaroides TaxID=273540 RepID=A0A9Q0GXJ1_9MAGN|nr:hypothetical protein NE237_012222 [Protea cynaroides]